jgi:hypothetical protein
MQSLLHSALLEAVPMQELLLLLGLFAVAALILFVLSVGAGNYPTISRILRQVGHAWHHRHMPDENYAEGRRIAGH